MGSCRSRRRQQREMGENEIRISFGIRVRVKGIENIIYTERDIGFGLANG